MNIVAGKLIGAGFRILSLFLFTGGLPRREDRAVCQAVSILAMFGAECLLALDPLPKGPLYSALHNGIYFLLTCWIMASFYRMQRNYTLFIVMILFFAWMIWPAVVTPYTFHSLGMGTWGYPLTKPFPDLISQPIIGLLRVASVLLLKRVLVLDPQREIRASELAVCFVPAAVNFFCSMLLYDMSFFSSLADVEAYFGRITILIVLLGISSVFILVSTEYVFRIKDERENAERLERQMAYQYEKFETLRRKDRELQLMRHDMKNQLAVLMELSEQEKKEYVKELLAETVNYLDQLDTGNAVVNVLMEQKKKQCQENGVRLEMYVDMKELTFLPSPDICTLFANAIDNGMEAASQLPDGRRTVWVKGGTVGDFLVVRFSNYYQNVLQPRGAGFLTTKKDPLGHGLGLESIRRVVEKYGGVMTIQTEKEKFNLTWMLPIPERSRSGPETDPGTDLETDPEADPETDPETDPEADPEVDLEQE